MTDPEGLVHELVKFGNWSESAVRYGIRANFCCEYCGMDLLASVDNFRQWENDHIVPTSASGLDSDQNIAVACRTCNWHIKRGWNPQDVCGADASRERLIRATQAYIRQQRTRFLRELVEVREIVDEWHAQQGAASDR